MKLASRLLLPELVCQVLFNITAADLTRTVGERSPHRVFLRQLSLLDCQTHHLQPIFSSPLFLQLVYNNQAFTSWKNDPLVGILRISGPPGSGTTAIAAHILGTLIDQPDEQNTVCLSFSFDKNNIHANSLFSFYLSICRQLLSSPSRLFQCISAVYELLAGGRRFSTKTLWAAVRSMMTHLLNDEGASVYCIIDAVSECSIIYPEVMKNMDEFIGLANGRFKLLLSGTNILELAAQRHQTRDISLEPGSDGLASSKQQYVQHKMRELAFENPAWYGLADFAVGQLNALPADSPYRLVELNILLLDWACRHSTSRDLKEELQQQPRTPEDCYTRALSAIDDANRTWVMTALRWIVYAVRPLRPIELAVATTLGDISARPPWGSEVLDGLGDLIRGDIIGDLAYAMAPFINIVDNRVYLIHDTFRVFLLDTFANTLESHEDPKDERTQDESMSGDGHYRVLFHCLEYLKSFGQHNAASIPSNDDSTQHSLPTDPEFGLLTYASLYWPQHFLKTTTKSKARGHVLEFLDDNRGVLGWTNI